MPFVLPAQYSGRYVYHFTHIDNLPGLLKTGFLANNHPNFPKKHRSIAAAGIQQRRAAMQVPCGPGGCVHDYVPLYFGSLSLMLLKVINAKNIDQSDILYFEFPIDLVTRDDVLFTDASANTNVPPNFFTDPVDLANLTWDAIDSKKWSEPTDLRRHQRMAEMLVYGMLPVTAAARCVVWNEDKKQEVLAIVQAAGAAFPPIDFETAPRYHWYTAFQKKTRSSLVTGPRGIARIYNGACQAVSEHAGKYAATAKFKSLDTLLAGLREDFGCVDHTAELVGLRSENGVHKLPVDEHTKEVVAKLLTLPSFQTLPPEDQTLAELAAYLHDIGKGPRSRWDQNGGLQKVDPDHPVGAMPMMVDILINQVAELSYPRAASLLKLVCYHDLIGDVLGKERDEEQIVEVANSVAELNMLFALGQADATALVEWWWDDAKATALYNRCRAAIEQCAANQGQG